MCGHLLGWMLEEQSGTTSDSLILLNIDSEMCLSRDLLVGAGDCANQPSCCERRKEQRRQKIELKSLIMAQIERWRQA